MADHMNRREMLSLMGAALATGAVGCRRSPAQNRLTSIGVQLYTVRSLMGQDFEGTLSQVGRIGYREVEFAGYYNRTPAQVRATLEAAGLTAPAAHLPIQALRQNWTATVEAAATMGHRYLIVPSLPREDIASVDALKRVADLFNRSSAAARDAGIRVGFHNHAVEFEPVEGRLPFDILLEETDPALVDFEMDLFWITKGGRRPLDYFARFPGRFVMVHVKDMDAAGNMVDVGQGAMEFGRIFAARQQAGIRHFFVEHDNPPAPLDSIRRSYEHLSTLAF